MAILRLKESMVLVDLLGFGGILTVFDNRCSYWKEHISKSIAHFDGILTESNEKVEIPLRDYVEFAASSLARKLLYLPEEKNLIKMIKSLEFETQKTKKIAFGDLQNLTKNMSSDLSFEGKILFLFLARAYE